MSNSDLTADEPTPLLERLRTFAGSPREFWPLFLEASAVVTGAHRAALWTRGGVSPTEGGTASWVPTVVWPAAGLAPDDTAPVIEAASERFASAGPEASFAVGGAESAGIVTLHELPARDLETLRGLCGLLATVPDAYQAGRETRRLRDELDGVVGALDLSLILGREPRFRGAALAVCNEFAARFRCDRVSLGWEENQVVRLVAMSQTDKFDKRMQLVRKLEVAMEEAIDQDEELAWPVTGDGRAVIRELSIYAQEAGVGHVGAIPLRSGGRCVAVCVLERDAAPWNEGDWRRLRLAADQVGPRLAELKDHDRGLLVRSWANLKRKSAGFLGPVHTGAKLAAIGGAAMLLFLLVGRLPYSVEAPAVLRSSQVVFVTAPFEGFVKDVNVAVGDAVNADSALAGFDTRELLLRQAAELANLNRYQKEIERARVQNALSDMAIAQAQAEQARAVLDRTRYQLEQAVVRAPFAGLVVEGDLRKRIGSPLRQGEVLFQIARIDELYVEIEVAERDVHDVLDRQVARLLFAAQPDRTYELAIERVHPAGQPRPAGPVFVVRARSLEAAEAWWRPGMSGTVKIDAGWRNVGWILTHRTVDWIRQRLWW